MSQRVRSSAKWQHTFRALTLANEAIGGKPAKQFQIADSEEPADVERWFTPGANASDKAKAREMLDYCFVGEGFDLTVDRGDAYYEGPRQFLSDAQKVHRRQRLAELHRTLGI